MANKRKRASRSRKTAPARIARVAKGRRRQYFSDPAIDKLLWITTTLIGELSVMRDRLDVLERVLNVAADVEAYEPTPEAEAEREARRQAYLERVMRVVQAELEETTRRDWPKSEAEIIAAVTG